jgi:hypothetical protein
MSGNLAGQTPCPKCAQPNPVAAEYCWACHFDLKPDAPVAPTPAAASSPRSAAARRYATGPALPSLDVDSTEPAPPPPSILRAVLLLLASAVIIGGSWWLLSQRKPVPLGLFASGWGIVLGISLLALKLLPAPPSGWRNYYSLNPFEYRDNWNRWLRSVRIWTFLPGIVLATISAWRDLLMPPKPRA